MHPGIKKTYTLLTKLFPIHTNPYKSIVFSLKSKALQ